MANYLDTEGLDALAAQIKAKFVPQELKTGSTTVKKVLSDNNLTDELLEKINNAGVSNFTGSYSDLTNKPTINGNTVTGAMTAAGLGLATPAEVTAAQSAALADAKAYVDGKGYDTATSVNSKIETAKDEIQESIDAAITSAYKAKGSAAFANLPTPAAANEGGVYNVTDAFTTTASFVEGAGKSYPAGTNVVCVNDGGTYKWDAMAGFVDLSAYLKKTDLTAISVDYVNSLFA